MLEKETNAELRSDICFSFSSNSHVCKTLFVFQVKKKTKANTIHFPDLYQKMQALCHSVASSVDINELVFVLSGTNRENV